MGEARGRNTEAQSALRSQRNEPTALLILCVIPVVWGELLAKVRDYSVVVIDCGVSTT